MDTSDTSDSIRQPVYGETIGEFAVGRTPAFRRHGSLTEGPPIAPDRLSGRSDVAPAVEDASRWQRSFAADVRSLATELFVHICGDSCYKYSPDKAHQICRHGFYYMVNLGQWEHRKEGICFPIKSIRNEKDGTRR